MPLARYELDDHFGSQATQIAVGHNCPNTEVLGPLGGYLGALLPKSVSISVVWMCSWFER